MLSLIPGHAGRCAQVYEHSFIRINPTNGQPVGRMFTGQIEKVGFDLLVLPYEPIRKGLRP